MAYAARAVGEIFKGEGIAGFPSGFKGAYRQVPGDPEQAMDFVVASWDPLACSSVFIWQRLAVLPLSVAPSRLFNHLTRKIPVVARWQ